MPNTTNKQCHHEAHEGHEGFIYFIFLNFVLPSTEFILSVAEGLRACFATSFENTRGGGPGSVLVRLLDFVIPAWSAGIQADMDVSGRILRNWMPAIHAGMTMLFIAMFYG